MSQRKIHNEDRLSRRDRTFLPKQGQGSDAETAVILNVFSTILEVLYEMCMCVARPVWSLVAYVVKIGVEKTRSRK